MMAYTSVRVIFEIGHEAYVRAKKTAEGFTHDWELFVRGADNSEIHHFVEKVIFHLHETFQNPKRVIKEPPYVVRESGYAGFALFVDVYFKNKAEPIKTRFKYQLTLQDLGPPISNVVREEYVFNNPAEDFRRKLIKGGGVGVGEESTSSNHVSTMNSGHSDIDLKNSLKNKSSALDLAVIKKLKKESIPKNEEKLNANDPFSIFGQPINTSKIPLLPKPNSKLISEKISQSDKQVHSSKTLKHIISSHKDKEKDKDRDKDKEKDREKDKHKTKDRDKEKDKSSVKKSKDESVKKDKIKDDKLKMLKSSKDETKKNVYHEEKPKEKTTEKIEKESKSEKKEKEKKHKEEKKLKSKEKHKVNEKKENVEVKESYGERADKSVVIKDENLSKEEKKIRKVDDREEKPDKVKEKSSESKNSYSNGSVNPAPVQPSNNNVIDNGKKEEKHKHHKHKKDKSKKDSKRDKEEKREKLKESKEKSTPPLVEAVKSTPKSESPKLAKKPLKRSFHERSDKSDSDSSSLDDEPITVVKANPLPDVSTPVKEESDVQLTVKPPEELVRDDELDLVPKKKKNKKSSEEKEAKKRKRKTKDKVENVVNKVTKYENQGTETAIKSNSLSDVQETGSESRQASLSPIVENKFTDEYVTKLKELQRKIMTLDDNSGLQRIVQLVAETGQYEITTKTFDFDLCTLDESIVQRLSDFFLP